MTSKLITALNKATDRKAAVAGIDPDSDGPDTVFKASAEEMMRLFVGYDLSPDELLEVSDTVAWVILKTQAATMPVPVMLSGLWLDGLLTGLMIERDDDEV